MNIYIYIRRILSDYWGHKTQGRYLIKFLTTYYLNIIIIVLHIFFWH